MPNTVTVPAPSRAHQGSRLVSRDGLVLPLRSTTLHATAAGGLARTRLVQRFDNPHTEPLSVEYLLPLPADGAVSGFSFRIGERRIQGQVERRAAARERFEQAVLHGHTAALLEQDRSSLFRQQLGNIPPGEQVFVEVEIDQPLQWIPGGEGADGGAWEYRFPTTVAPRFQGVEGRVPDATRQRVDVADAPLPAQLELQLVIADRVEGSTVRSPSHVVRCVAGANAATTASLPEPARMDRDVVVRWQVAGADVQATLECARPQLGEGAGDDAFGLLTLVPPRRSDTAVPRDLVLLIDTSGSMGGAPLAGAVAIARALVDTLTDRDRLQMVEFSSRANSWRSAHVAATDAHRQDAKRWLAALQARGGTEMLTGVQQALRPLDGESQTQVVLLSDGLIDFEREITAHLLQELPRGCRFHVVGVGDAVNRSLTQAAARAGRGREAIVGIGEDVTDATRRMVAAMQTPVVVDVTVEGAAVRGVSPETTRDLLHGAPTRLLLRLDPRGGDVVVRGRCADGDYVQRLQAPPTAIGAGRRELATAFARERVEDLEMHVAATGGGDLDADAEIERLGLSFSIATRHTSWIAVSDAPTVDPREATRREVMPHELPFGMSVTGLGLRSASMPGAAAMPAGAGGGVEECADFLGDEPFDGPAQSAPPQPAPTPARKRSSIFGDLFGSRGRRDEAAPTLVAFLTRRADGQLVFEIAAEGGRAAWRCPDEVEVRWSDGTCSKLAVDAAHSTRSTKLHGRRTARLVVLCDDHASAMPMDLTLPDGTIVAIFDRRP